MLEVSRLVSEAAAAGPARQALIDADEGTLTWAQVEERVAATAGGLTDAGVRPGDRVAVLLPNGAAFAVAAWAVLRAGATLVPVNPLYTPPEIAHIVADSAAVAVVTGDRLVAGARAAVQDLPDARVLEADAAGLAGPPVGRSPATPQDCAVICYTSGTSGRAKGARLTHANVLANLEAIRNLRHLQLDASDVLLGVLPFCHVFGLNVILNCAASVGAAVLTLPRFTPQASLEAMARHGVTIAYGAPPMFAAWNLAADKAAGSLRLRAAVSGADSLPVAVWEGFEAGYGIRIVEGYGLTETAPVLASTAVSPEVRPGTVGHPVQGVQLRVVDPPTGLDAVAGQPGEILACGPNVFAGYHNLPAETGEAFEDGWFRTGDLGTFDEEGYLRIVGRLKDLVIVSGFNVYPREVEQALVSHPGVAEAAVTGVPDSRTGERVHATVVPVGGVELDTEELIDHCRGRLARYKLPRQVDIVDSLPGTALGKVRRTELGS